MSLFRKPKKPIQRRIFTSYDDEDAENEKMNADAQQQQPPPPPASSRDHQQKDKKRDRGEYRDGGRDRDRERDRGSSKKDAKSSKVETLSSKPMKPTALLSFGDDEDETEIFQVKKSSHSKKVMRMLDKERKKKKYKDDRPSTSTSSVNSTIAEHSDRNDFANKNHNSFSNNNKTTNVSSGPTLTTKDTKTNNNSDKIQTEIRTDDFVLVVKKSETQNVILNGRAALCAGRDDMSSEDNNSEDENDMNGGDHKFQKPDNFKLILESGEIPDAAMIHAARKRRQKAREQGDFIPLEEVKPEPAKRGRRLQHDENDDDASEDEERVDMNAITGIREREERREKFYSVQQEYSGDESELEMNEWENQQIRKGVTGAQLVTAQHESVLSQFIIKSSSCQYDDSEPQSTGRLLEQAYAKNSLEKPRQILLSGQKDEQKVKGPRTPLEINEMLSKRLTQLNELNVKHINEIESITRELKAIKLETADSGQRAPIAAAKYRFYQELRGYVTDLVECLDEKTPLINDLEKRTITVLSKHANFFIERRRQDVRDQAKEIADSLKQGTAKKGPEDISRQRRTAEREGRRTRRRFERERNEFSKDHLDGMSSDDEMNDRNLSDYKTSLDQLEVEADDLFVDASEEYYRIENILLKFEIWRKTDMDSYKDAFVSLCLHKIVGPIIRAQMLTWNPLGEKCVDIEKMEWFQHCMTYAFDSDETEDTLTHDPDVRFVPAIIEKVIIPKLTEIIDTCWDPLSTTQTLRLVGIVARYGREYPSLRESSKPLKALFICILDKMKNSLENDVFIPIFPKQAQEARTSFFQRQFCSGLKLFRNLLSWQGIISDDPLKQLAISSLLNRYLLSAMRVCTPTDAISKAYVIVNTIPTTWLQKESEILDSLHLLIAFIKNIYNQIDRKNPFQLDAFEKAKQVLQRLHNY